jgi:hypothetical protein
VQAPGCGVLDKDIDIANALAFVGEAFTKPIEFSGLSQATWNSSPTSGTSTFRLRFTRNCPTAGGKEQSSLILSLGARPGRRRPTQS